MKTRQELAERRDHLIAESNALCEVDKWTDEQMRRYHEIEDERCEIEDELDRCNQIEALKDDNADLARLIDQMNRFRLDTSQVEERIAQNFKIITKLENNL